MNKIDKYVDDIAFKLDKLGIEDLVVRGQPTSLTAAIIMKLQLDVMSKQFAEIMGIDRLEAFYSGYEPRDSNAVSCLHLPLARIVPSFCSMASNGAVTVDKTGLVDALTGFAQCVKTGRVPYSLSLRVANIDISDDFELADGIWLRKISRTELRAKYPIERQFTPLSQLEERHWENHCVEAVLERTGTPLEIQRWLRIDHSEAFINSILHTFLVACVPPESHPFATHFVLSSPIEGHCLHRGQSGFRFTPAVITDDEMVKLRGTYKLLTSAGEDRVLQTAIDRFILGRKRSTHHPNRINEPHWDKIVDYVIALETLLLTVHKNGMNQELSYRFRLNGASLLRDAVQCDVYQAFHALKHLYGLRSTVVHGGSRENILKPANRFIEQLGIDCPNHENAMGRISLVARAVEEWITKIAFHLNAMPFDERPYRQKDGWEQLLW